MSLTYGFYNALNHDRKYNAVQMSKIFDGIIKDGIFMSIGDCLVSKAGTGMSVNVGIGKAWFNHTWTENDAILPVEAYASEVVMNRIDALVLEINATDASRVNSIKFIKGTPATVPVVPALINTATVHQYLLCTVTILAGVTAITDTMITNYIGTTNTPFVSGILETVNLDTLLGQWQGMLDAFVSGESEAFTVWFNAMKGQLTTDAAGNLQTQINAITAKLLSNNVVLYVSTTGSDTNGTGTSDLPYATITKALSVIPKNLNGFDATVNIGAGTYTDSLVIKGFFGGSINITLLGNVSMPTLYIEETTRCYLNASTTTTLTLINQTGIPLQVVNRSFCITYNVDIIINGNTAYTGLLVVSGSYFVGGSTVTINNALTALRVSASTVSIVTLTGSGNSLGINSDYGSIIAYVLNTITATTLKTLSPGTIIANNLTKTATVTLVAGVATGAWIAMSGGYYQEVTATGYYAGEEPIADLVPATFPFPTIAEQTAASYVFNKKCVNNGTVTFYATVAPTVKLTYKLKGV